MKYQFCIRFDNIDANSSASKAVLDCNRIFDKNGYKDYTLTVGDNSNRRKYYLLLAKEVFRFFLSLKRGSIVGIQYPLLSVNSMFKYFINVARLKNVRFFCVVHDLESLRIGGKNQLLIDKEVQNLNNYNALIVHNNKMHTWLQNAGVNVPMHSLELFDYLAPSLKTDSTPAMNNGIVYAGNLRKSTFIYSLPQIKTSFNLYGPGFNRQALPLAFANINWCGEFNPEEIVKQIKGSFGLIWDGTSIEKCDEVLGNYLRYNNPHKCSLYIAAGLPVIAPADSAIGDFVKLHQVGLTIDNLYDLDNLTVAEEDYHIMLSNVAQLRKKVINGAFFTDAIHIIENEFHIGN